MLNQDFKEFVQSLVTTQALHLAFNNAENAIGSDQDFPFFD